MRITTALLFLCLLVAPLRAEWKEPADGVITDKQMTNYLGAMKEVQSLFKAAGKAAEGQGAVGAMGLWAKTSEKYQAILAKNNLSDEEFTWLSGKVSEAWVGATVHLNWEKQGLPASQEQEKKLRADIDTQKSKVAEYEAAAKSGHRVLDADARKAAVERAKSEQDDAAANLKSTDEEIANQQKEIAEKDAAAKAADALAAKPPGDVAQEDREGYIEGKKQEAAGLRQEAKDLRDQLAEKQKTRKVHADALASAKARGEHPEVPTTDEDKANVKTENENGLKAAREQLKASEDGLALLVEGRDATQKQIDEITKNTPKPNVELLKKRYGDFCDAMGMKNEYATEKK
jgi:hypothetical protein